jgi:hypothetical protein
MKNKVLIVKTGYSETFTEKISSDVCSLGDVLRTTFILHSFQEEEVHWLTSDEALPLLKNNQSITKLYTTLKEIECSQFKSIINLEKDITLINSFRDNNNLIGFKLSDTLALEFKKNPNDSLVFSE